MAEVADLLEWPEDGKLSGSLWCLPERISIFRFFRDVSIGRIIQNLTRQFFLRHNIIGHTRFLAPLGYWVRGPQINEVVVYRWSFMFKFWKKIDESRNVELHVSHEKGCFRKEDVFLG